MKVRLFKLLNDIWKDKNMVFMIFLVVVILYALYKYHFNKFKCIMEIQDYNPYEQNIELWHEKRRQQILKKYPQIKELEKADNYMGTFDTIIMFSLMTLKYYILYQLIYVSKLSLGLKTVIILALLPMLSIIVASYTHDLGHLTTFSNPNVNMFFLMLTDLYYYGGSGFTTYAYMHKHHHDPKYSGTEKDITVLPYACEEKIISNKWYEKVMYQIFSPFRNMVLYKKIFKEPYKLPVLFKLLNYIRFVLMILYVPELFVVHYISEVFQFYNPLYPSITDHIELKKGVMTNTYHGWLNNVTHNLYHHMEHHDFENINGRHYPKLRQIAPEFYTETYNDKIGLFFKILFSSNYTMSKKLN